MASTNYVQIDSGNNNLLSDAAYGSSPLTLSGYPSGAIVPSNWFNKAWYQLSTFCAAFAAALVLKGYNVFDTSISALTAVFANVRTTADVIPAIQTVAYSPTPVFNASLGLAFDITLTGNVTSSTLVSFVAGEVLTWIIRQNSGGGNTFAWPSNVTSPPAISLVANAVSMVTFRVGQAADVRPMCPMVIS